MARGKK